MRNKQGFYSADLAADERETEEMREALGVQTVATGQPGRYRHRKRPSL
jgi:hypothetical protein